jgi:hypothetical protein
VLDLSNPAAPIEVAVYPAVRGPVVAAQNSSAAADGWVYVLGEGLTLLRSQKPTEHAPIPTATPPPEREASPCEAYTASVGLSADRMRPCVGDTITVTAQLYNLGCGTLGMPQYSLHIETEGDQRLFAATPEPVVRFVGVSAGQSDTITFALHAVQPGRATLTAAASFEFHGGAPGPAYWGGTGSGTLQLTVCPSEQELVPKEQ